MHIHLTAAGRKLKARAAKVPGCVLAASQCSLAEVLELTDRTHAVGGREGTGRSGDGRIEVTLSSPGGAGRGTNPEQLFGIGYSACFLGALKAVAPKLGVAVPADTTIAAEVDLGPTSLGYGIAVRMTITLPGLQRAKAQELVAEAHKVCPYSNATRGNIAVDLTVG